MRCVWNSIFLLLLGLPTAMAERAQAPLDDEVPLSERSIQDLEERLVEIHQGLNRLAHHTLRSGTGALGYRSKHHRDPNARESIHLKLAQEAIIDQIVLVPALYRNTADGVNSSGFPIAFRILVHTGDSHQEVASYSAKDRLLPRIAPLVVPITPVLADGITIEATKLSARNDSPSPYTLEFSEVFVFSGKDNVMIPITHDSPAPLKKPAHNNARSLTSLTDTFTPFVMDAAHGVSKHAILLVPDSKEEPSSLTLDLKRPYLVHQLNLHTADVSLTVPLHELSCRAVPRHIKVTGASKKDFSDETLLCSFRQKSIYDNGPILIRRFPETRCRYIRLTIIDPRPVLSLDEGEEGFAFSEVEVLTRSVNVARGARVTPSPNLTFRNDALPRITDGLNNYGHILPLRDWMTQLALRHDLDKERHLVATTLKERYAQRGSKLRWMRGLVIFLVVGTIICLLLLRLIHLQKMQRMRTRFAADLHDELGANLHTIALLSDAAKVSRDTDEEWNMLHRRIRDLAGRTSTAVRHFSNIANAEGLYEGLLEDMQRISRRILAKVDHTLEISGEEHLRNLKSHIQVDLYLFYKESLMNICRHSHATQARSHLSATSRLITLTINDNGKGLAQENIPPALMRRARILRAKLSVDPIPAGGTSIRLELKNQQRFWSKRAAPQ